MYGFHRLKYYEISNHSDSRLLSPVIGAETIKVQLNIFDNN